MCSDFSSRDGTILAAVTLTYVPLAGHKRTLWRQKEQVHSQSHLAVADSDDSESRTVLQNLGVTNERTNAQQSLLQNDTLCE